MTNSIESVVSKYLCTGCGTCRSVCPHQAITMTRSVSDFIVPEVDASKCDDCGICLLCCPGNGLPIDLTKNYDDIFKGENIHAYIGRASDEEIWKNGQSGGVVSALLLYLLDSKMVDAAVVNAFDNKNNRPFVKTANNRKELIESQGSYYSQTAVNEVAISNTLKTAAVVLGCQAQGIALTKLYSKTSEVPEYLIGLICGGNHTGLIIDDIIKKSQLDPKKISTFRFRDKQAGGWPGNIRIKSNNRQVTMDKKERMILKDIYGVYRCQCCFDKMNIFSDIVVGDPWGIEADNKKEGLSVFITRTKKGEELVKKVIRDEYIMAKEIEIESVYKGQKIDTERKTKFLITKEICEKNNIPFPEYKVEWLKYKYEKPNKSKSKYYEKFLKHKAAMQKAKSKEETAKIVKKQKQNLKFRRKFLKNASRIKRVVNKLFRSLLTRNNSK